MKKGIALVLLPLALTACEAPAPEERLSIMTRSTEPLYQKRADGKIAASSCLARTPASYGNVPSACTIDTITAQQVANPHDLVHPHPPGPAPAYPRAAAAYEYIYGEMPNDAAAEDPQPGILIPVEPDPAAAEDDAG
ncbi:MAG: hypothetical protein AAGA87_02585 [Pseudomonadota bacterium]